MAAKRRSKKLGRIPRPGDMSPEAIGLRVAGSCLAPRVNDGDGVIVDLRLPAPGDLAVFWFKGRKEPLVKILKSNLRGFWPLQPNRELTLRCEVEQTNPRERFAFMLDKIERIGRVSHVVPSSQVRLP